MSKYLTERIVALVDKEVDFSKEVKTKELSFTNYQTAKICFAVAGENTENKATTNVTINAVLDDDSKVEIRKEEIELVEASIVTIDFVADEISHYNARKIEIVVDAIEDSTFKGNIFAVVGHARYEIQDDEIVSGEATNGTDSEQDDEPVEETNGTENTEHNTENNDNSEQGAE